MAARESARGGYKITKPILSGDYCEAHRRVMGLYRAYFRYLPYVVRRFDIPKTPQDCRMKLREYFYKNACVTDLRVIDILVIKGFMNLREMTDNFQQMGHVMAHWHPTLEPKRCDFIGKFLANED
ncbi:NADH dehydrogenase [ubiquinone] 1 alpha subcomplex subunit 6-like [Bicyclus anynana]|uniref:NADH dehydrogenase [ubiquinone] 1 alpha subcomplex subunit 6 n=1 Tax=Bicyclus anynana TaxID=110368 RepID=A0ABM3LRA7_BICAN|nr:NADH dehydrogenase [ubiquinone] 1 alpha subcomplex subunit 6-like [Bicyclus anynana]